ncbi:IS4 family transposase [bacterium]|nr:IS4 family transposase [candidate division CSSED10-310 bacterium]
MSSIIVPAVGLRRKAERHAEGFQCWTQFVSILFFHVAQADSLRDICNGLRCCRGKLVHLGIRSAPKRSTLAYANEYRTSIVYERLFYETYDRFKSEGKLGKRKTKFRFKNKLLSLDSNTISLCLSIFPWASFRRSKGGIKLHILLDHDHYMPEFIAIREAKRHDVTIAKSMTLNPGSIVAMDRAYNDYRLFSKCIDRDVDFVIRMKDNAQYEVIDMRQVPQNQNILSDEIIKLAGVDAEKKCPHLLRRIAVWDKKNNREIVLLTNHMTF